jgi:hypothetical protein
LPNDDVHVIVDALFPTAETIATATAAGIRVTWSQNAAHKSHLMSVLSDGLAKKEWRAACIPTESLDQHYFVLSDSKVMIGGMVILSCSNLVLKDLLLSNQKRTLNYLWNGRDALLILQEA